MYRTFVLLILLTAGCAASAPEGIPDTATETTLPEETPQTTAPPEPTPGPTPAPIVYEKNPTDDPFLDQNGDGFQDVIVSKNRVHYDIDFDGKLDYTTSLKFTEYESEGHREYIESGFDKEVYRNLTMAGLDALCANDREAAKWIEENFETYEFWHDGYSFLAIFSESEVNDHRITSPKEKGEYDYRVIFNPDGSIRSITRDSEKVTLAEFDYGTNTNDGEKVYLPTKLETMEDLEVIKAKLDSYFA